MKIIETTILPIEFFIPERLADCVSSISEHFENEEGRGELKYYRRLSGNPKAYLGTDLPCAFFGGEIEQNTRILFDDTSCVFILKRVYSTARFDTKWALNAAKRKSRIHQRLTSKSSQKNPYYYTLRSLLLSSGLDPETYWPSYAFSFCTLISESEGDICESAIKLFLEPSLAGVDDLIDRGENDNIDHTEMRIRCAEDIALPEDKDLLIGCKFYSSWATIISIVPNDESIIEETLSILVGLEARVQMIWNKCYSTSIMIDDTISKNKKDETFERMYLSFSKSFDDAQSVLSSSISSRAQKFLDDIIQTSKLQMEISTLSMKLNLMEKHLNRMEKKREDRYGIVTESVLFLIALTAILDLLVGFPILKLGDSTKIVITNIFVLISALVFVILIMGRWKK